MLHTHNNSKAVKLKATVNQLSSQIARDRLGKKQLFGLLASALFLIFVYPKTYLDQWLIAPYFNDALGKFSLKHDFVLENILHTDLKCLMLAIGLSAFAAWVFSFKFNQIKAYRQALFQTFIGILLATSVVSVFKYFSVHACPWSLSMYGGNQPLLGLFDSLPSGAELGKCFPAGHASGGFALWAFYFGFKKSQPKIAQLGLYSGLFFGFIMGWAQMMRGAHFFSHTLWTAWLVYLVLVLLNGCFSMPKETLQRFKFN